MYLLLVCRVMSRGHILCSDIGLDTRGLRPDEFWFHVLNHSSEVVTDLVNRANTQTFRPNIANSAQSKISEQECFSLLQVSD